MTRELIIDTADFKKYDCGITIHDGVEYRLYECYEFEGGKWEGFVSMKRVK